MRFLIPLLASLLATSLGCKSNDQDPQKDIAVPDQPAADRPIPDEPFGRVCTDLGKPCREKDINGGTLYCIAITGSPKGKGYCTRQCTDVGNECYGVPNGQYAACIVGDKNVPDAGPTDRYCGFLCKSIAKDGKTSVWSCPATMRCGTVENGTALCVPQDIIPPDRGVLPPDVKPRPDSSQIPSNSGKICSGAEQCAPTDDCLLIKLQGQPTPTQKMCVMRDCKPGSTCPAPSGPYSSLCFGYGAKNYCFWFCEYEGKTYQCPDNESFQCIVPDSTQPGVKLCIPK